jgi:shikimate kinase
MTLKLKRTPGLYLVGFMCSGKTTVGRAVADELGWCFSDLDQEIEREQGLRVTEIFHERGEAEFRELESEMLRKCVAQIESGNPCVLALGGGAFAQQRNWETIENNGVTVWLKCSLEIIQKRLGDVDTTRPLSADRERMRQLYSERQALYARADFVVDAGLDRPEDVMRQILGLPIF